MANDFSRPQVSLVDQDGNPISVQLENGKYFLHVQDEQTQQVLIEVRDALRAILARLTKDD